MTTAEHAADTAVRPANPLTVRAFRNLWFNNVAFFLVLNAQRFVFGWLVLDGLLRSESIQGLVVFTLGVPTALLVLQAGAWADRWDRRKMLIITQIASGVVMAGTAIAISADAISLGWVIVATLLAGSASAIGSPVRSAMIPTLVAKEQLFSAIALNAIAITLSMILGPVLAKVVGDRDVPLLSFHSTSKGFYGECGKRGGYVEVRNPPAVEGTDVSLLEILLKLASVNLCSNVVGHLLTYLMVNRPRPGQESYERFAHERDEILAALETKANMIREAFAKMDGVECFGRTGALYLFPRLGRLPAGTGDFEYCMALLEETGLCTVNG